MNLYKSKYGWARVLIIVIPYILFVGNFEFAGMYVTRFTFAYFDGEVQRTYQKAVQHLFSCTGTLLFLWGGQCEF